MGTRLRFCGNAVVDASTGRTDDYVVATGQQHTVRDFYVGSRVLGITLEFVGDGLDEQGIAAHNRTCKKFCENWTSDFAGRSKVLSPIEVNTLLGDLSKARRKLGWSPKTSARELCKKWECDFEMILGKAS